MRGGASMAMTFQGATGVPVDVLFEMDSGCNAQYSVLVSSDPAAQPDDHGGSQAAQQTFDLDLADGLSTVDFVATPLCPTAASANLRITVSQNGNPLTPLATNDPSGNPAVINGLASKAPTPGSLDVNLT